MRARLLSVFLLSILFFVLASNALAHDDQNEHDADLRYALFGERDKTLSEKQRLSFKAIADAAAITIDQFSPNESAQWKKGTFEDLQSTLKKLGISQLSVSFENIDLNIRVSDDNKNITANSHRRYTHMGWNYKKYPNQEFWQNRKQILLYVINRVLFTPEAPFSWVPLVSDFLYSSNEQCDAFSAMVYYIHILGDHIEGNIPDKLTNLEPLIQYTNLSTPGIISEMKEQLQIVFLSQKNGWQYAALMQELSDLGVRAEQNCGTWGAVDTIERCQINQRYASELLSILSQYLPQMLQKEPFFSERFKP